jgi:hypothetical protein
MQINFKDYDLENFLVKEDEFCGIPSRLIQPSHLGTKFTQKNKILRSSIWSLDGKLLSASFPKFVNFLENQENFPVPTSLNGCKIVDKIDGSTCIIDCIDCQISMRSRGTSTYLTLENFKDFDYCLSKYPKIKEWIINHPNHSLLMEITTPNMKIVLSYGDEPDFWLIGCINKDDYSLISQPELDNLSNEIGVKRPEYYTFSSLDTLLESIKAIKGKEGCCLYSNGDTEIHKIKGEFYLKLHRMKSELSSCEKVLDVWMSQNKPTYEEFYNFILNTFDFELAEYCKDNIIKIIVAYDKVNDNISRMREVVTPLLSLSRKDSALIILESYKYHSSYLFKLLSGKELDDKDIKKLLLTFLK